MEIVTVSSIMTKAVKTAKEGQTVRAAAKLMAELGIGSLVVVKNSEPDTPVGIITERDIIRLLGSRSGAALANNLREVMSRPLITVEPQSSVRDAIQIMHSKNIRRLPVAKEGKLLGIITNKDIFRAIVQSQSLAANILGERLVSEYKPMYESLSAFVLGEMLIPDRNP